MVIEMFKRSKSKGNVNSDSRESLSGNQSSSNENLDDTRERKFESTSSLYRTTQFDVFFLGMIKDVNLSHVGGPLARDLDVQLIDKVEEAQVEGKMSLLPKEEDLVVFMVNKHGIRVADQHRKMILQRHPLHTVAQIVYYTDSFFKSNIAFKIGQVGSRQVYDCYVFQCYTEDDAQSVCQSIKDVFDTITSHTA